MKEFQDIPFRWSDAWLLLSVALAAKSGSTTLAAVIGAADNIQHAIITKAEIDGGVERLARGGLLELTADHFTLTPSSQTIIDHAAEAAPLIRDQQKLLENALGATPWTPGYKPDSARGEKEPLITQEDYSAAVKRYHKSYHQHPKS
jgi:hypothetical protein